MAELDVVEFLRFVQNERKNNREAGTLLRQTGRGHLLKGDFDGDLLGGSNSTLLPKGQPMLDNKGKHRYNFPEPEALAMALDEPSLTVKELTMIDDDDFEQAVKATGETEETLDKMMEYREKPTGTKMKPGTPAKIRQINRNLIKELKKVAKTKALVPPLPPEEPDDDDEKGGPELEPAKMDDAQFQTIREEFSKMTGYIDGKWGKPAGGSGQSTWLYPMDENGNIGNPIKTSVPGVAKSKLKFGEPVVFKGRILWPVPIKNKGEGGASGTKKKPVEDEPEQKGDAKKDEA